MALSNTSVAHARRWDNRRTARWKWRSVVNGARLCGTNELTGQWFVDVAFIGKYEGFVEWGRFVQRVIGGQCESPSQSPPKIDLGQPRPVGEPYPLDPNAINCNVFYKFGSKNYHLCVWNGVSDTNFAFTKCTYFQTASYRSRLAPPMCHVGIQNRSPNQTVDASSYLG